MHADSGKNEEHEDFDNDVFGEDDFHENFGNGGSNNTKVNKRLNNLEKWAKGIK